MIIDLIAFLLTLATSASLIFYLLSLLAARRFFSGSAVTPPPGLPPVSVMIPLRGVDFEAYRNYVSFCRQDYPVFQIVFGVRDPDDTSIAVVKQLISDFPEMDIELVIGSEDIGTNPKVNNLHNMLSKARHEIIVVVDSDIRVRPDYLASIIPPLTLEKTGLVTCLYRAGAAPNRAALLEAVGITGEFAPGVLVANFTEGMTFAFGATMATTKSVLAAIGGFKAIADYLADDYMLGNLIRKAGFEIRLLPHVVETVLPPVDFRKMLKHQIRWSRGIQACRPAGHFGSVLTNGSAMALLNFLFHGGSGSSFALLVLVMAMRLLMGWFVGVRCLGDGILKRNLGMLFPRDLLSFFVWCASLAGNRVEWRKQQYRLLKGGRFLPVGHDPGRPQS